MIAAASMNPGRYPPVGPRITETPPLKPEKTGSPTAPSRMYIITLITDLLEPSTPADTKTASVCNETGTLPSGKLTHEPMHIMAVNTAISETSTVSFLFVFMFNRTQPHFNLTTLYYCFWLL